MSSFYSNLTIACAGIAGVVTLFVGWRVSKVKPARRRRALAWGWWSVGTAATWLFIALHDVIWAIEDGLTPSQAIPASTLLVALRLLVVGIVFLMYGATLGLWVKEESHAQ